MELRDYQVRAIDLVRGEYRRGRRAVLLDSAGFVRAPWPSEEWIDAEGSGQRVPEWRAIELARGDL
jgi:hypothetical protein